MRVDLRRLIRVDLRRLINTDALLNFFEDVGSSYYDFMFDDVTMHAESEEVVRRFCIFRSTSLWRALWLCHALCLGR